MKINNLSIRTANEEDIIAIHKLIRQEFSVFLPQFRPTALSWEVNRIKETKNNWFICRRKNDLIGAVHHDIDPLGYTFDTLVVASSWRRNGVGSLLVSHIEDKAISVGSSGVAIVIRRSIRENQRFIESNGYRIFGKFSKNHDLYYKEICNE